MAGPMVATLMGYHGDGPVYLIGYSLGEYLAIEVAQQLVAYGKAVPLVAIIDQMPSRASFTLVFRILHFFRNVGPWVLRAASRIATDPKQRLNYSKAFLQKVRRQRSVENESWYLDLPANR